MELKLEKNEAYAVLIVFLLSIGFWQFPSKTTLPEFGPATGIRLAMMGTSSPLHIQAAAQAARLFGAGLEPQGMVSFLLAFSPLLLALSSVFIYLALRQLNFRKTPSAFAAILFPLSLSAMAFLPGVYSSSVPAALFFSLFLLCFASFFAKKAQLMLAPALLFAALSSYTNAAFGIAVAASVLSFGAGAYLKGDRRLVQFCLLLVVAAAGLFLSPESQQLYFSVQGIGAALSLSPFILAAASVSAVLFFLAAGGTEYFLLFISGIFVSIFSPVAGAALLAIPAGAGVSAAMEESLKRPAKLASAFFIAFFALLGLATASGTELYKAAAIAGMLAVLAPLLLHFYEYRNHRLLPAFALSLVALSAATALFYQSGPQRDYFPQYSDKDLSAALSQLSGTGAQAIAIIGSQDAARFYVPSATFAGQKEISAYLLTGAPRPEPGSHLVLSLSYLDDPTQLGSESFEAYFHSNNFSSGASSYALFFSQQGRLIAREIGADGSLSLKDGILLDQSGRSYGEMPLSRMILLKPSQPFSGRGNRMIVLAEGSPLPYFMKIYSGEAEELGAPQEFGKVSVYRAK